MKILGIHEFNQEALDLSSSLAAYILFFKEEDNFDPFLIILERFPNEAVYALTLQHLDRVNGKIADEFTINFEDVDLKKAISICKAMVYYNTNGGMNIKEATEESWQLIVDQLLGFDFDFEFVDIQ